MNTEDFHRLVDIPGPFVSAYLDDSQSDAVKRRDVEWRGLRHKLEHMGADPSAVDQLENAVLNSRPAVGRQGRAVVVTHERTLINEHLTRTPTAAGHSGVGLPIPRPACGVRVLAATVCVCRRRPFRRGDHRAR